MTMPTRVAAGVPAGGRFAPTDHAEPDVALGDGLPALSELVSDYLATRDTHRRVAIADADRFEIDGTVELRQALRQVDRRAPEFAEISMYYNDRKKHTDLPELDPPDGTVLIAEVMSGMYPLTVTGGRVVYRARSHFGNAITVRGGDVHIVTDGCNRKVTVSIEADDVDNPPRVTIAAPDNDPASRVRVYDRDSHKRCRLEVRDTNVSDVPLEWMQQ